MLSTMFLPPISQFATTTTVYTIIIGYSTTIKDTDEPTINEK